MVEVKFLTLLHDLSSVFVSSVQDVAGMDIAAQFDRVIVPVQKIGGAPENFSVMSFPYPRLTREELKNVPLIDEMSYILNVAGIEFRVDIDHFGQINWIYVKGASNIYEELKVALSRVAEGGDYTEFWKY